MVEKKQELSTYAANLTWAMRVAVMTIVTLVTIVTLPPGHLYAFQAGSISGTVADQLGGTVAASITLYRNGEEAGQTTSGANGAYIFSGLASGRYQVEAAATGFSPSLSDPIFLGSGGSATIDLSVQIGVLEQEISVTASATALPLAQIAAPVSVIDADLIELLAKPDILESLRTVPGLSVVQTGARGGTTSVFIRGGEADFTKVLIDGAPANDIGGGFSFDSLSTAAVESVEVLRTANSVLYGSDAMSGVINVETRRGRTPLPLTEYAIDGGTFGTLRNELSVGQTVGRWDYFIDGSILDTNNHLPNNKYRNESFASRGGVLLGSTTDINATYRRTESRVGLPNGILYYGIPDDAKQRVRQTYVTAGSVTEVDRISMNFRYSYTERDSVYTNPSPTGEPYDPFNFGANYLGNTVTIVGENGYSVTGRAILDFGGTYPSIFPSNTRRHMFTGSADVDVTESFDLSFGGRVEDEEALGGVNRRNNGYFVEARGNAGQRLFLTGGLSLEDHAVFGTEVVPRGSVAFYARQPASDSMVGETKLTFNIGKGIKAPSAFDDQSSLFRLLSGAGEQGLIDQYGVEPINAERTRSIDAGIEQTFWDGRVRTGISYFNSRYEDLIEFVSMNALPSLGVPADVATASGFGATINSASFDAQGFELTGQLALGRGFRASGWYTYLDAEVTESFSSSALGPSFNPAFPNIPIGQYSPLVGARPFRRPTHTSGLTLSYTHGPASVAMTSSFAGHQDDSTFLSDQNFGTSLLLPNKDLSGNYQKVDLSGSYQVSRMVKWYISVENLLDQQYRASGGFPANPINARTGVRFTFGGGE